MTSEEAKEKSKSLITIYKIDSLHISNEFKKLNRTVHEIIQDLKDRITELEHDIDFLERGGMW